MALEPLTAGLEFGTALVNRLWPDATESEKAKINTALAMFTAQAEIVRTEAQSEHFLASCWRPILMLTFGALIVARWMGWAVPNLTEAEYLKLWDIVELGLGGYVIGRSGEKIIPKVAEILKK